MDTKIDLAYGQSISVDIRIYKGRRCQTPRKMKNIRQTKKDIEYYKFYSPLNTQDFETWIATTGEEDGVGIAGRVIATTDPKCKLGQKVVVRYDLVTPCTSAIELDCSKFESGHLKKIKVLDIKDIRFKNVSPNNAYRVDTVNLGGYTRLWAKADSTYLSIYVQKIYRDPFDGEPVPLGTPLGEMDFLTKFAIK